MVLSQLKGLSIDFDVELSHFLALVDAEIIQRDLLTLKESTKKFLRNALCVLSVCNLKLSLKILIELALFLLNIAHFY